tara:strand:+ start:1371 stop:1949 length:579 start_codon:yes stop_codon:yes gene_type:complete
MSDVLLDFMEADTQSGASNVEAVSDGGLQSVANLAIAVRDKEALISELEGKLKEQKRELLKLTDEDLPALLLELGITKFELEDGSKIEVRPTYGAHIKAENKPAAFEWLRDNEFGDIIKNTVACNFGRGEDGAAYRFIEAAQKMGYSPEQKTDVHPSTLKAWVKERVEQGEEFPMELFGAFVGQRATIKRGK